MTVNGRLIRLETMTRELQTEALRAMSDEELEEIVASGRGEGPDLEAMSTPELEALCRYLEAGGDVKRWSWEGAQ